MKTGSTCGVSQVQAGLYNAVVPLSLDLSFSSFRHYGCDPLWRVISQLSHGGGWKTLRANASDLRNTLPPS